MVFVIALVVAVLDDNAGFQLAVMEPLRRIKRGKLHEGMPMLLLAGVIRLGIERPRGTRQPWLNCLKSM